MPNYRLVLHPDTNRPLVNDGGPPFAFKVYDADIYPEGPPAECCCGGSCCCEHAPGPASVSVDVTFTAQGGAIPADACECLNQTGLALSGEIGPCETPGTTYSDVVTVCGGSNRTYAVTCVEGWSFNIDTFTIPLTLISCNPLHLVGSATGLPATSCGGFSGLVDIEVEVTE